MVKFRQAFNCLGILLLFSLSSLECSSSSFEDPALSTVSGDSDGDISEEEISSQRSAVNNQALEKRVLAVLEKPQFHSILLPWFTQLYATEEDQKKRYKKGERDTRLDLSTFKNWLLVSKQCNRHLSLPIEPQDNAENDLQILESKGTPLLHLPLHCFDNELIRKRFEVFLQGPLTSILPIILCAPNSADKLFNFFLSYFDLPPRKRAVLMRGHVLIDNSHAEGVAVVLARWEPYKKACIIASQLHHQEAMLVIRSNAALAGQPQMEVSDLEVEQKKMDRSDDIMQSISLLHAMITRVINEELTLEKKGYEKIAAILGKLEQAYKTIQNKALLNLNLSKKTEKCCDYKDAAEELLTACSSIKNPPVRTIKHLRMCIYKLNKLMGENLEAFSDAQNLHSRLAGLLNGRQPFPLCADVMKAVKGYLTTIPGLPTAETYYSFYSYLMKSTENKKQQNEPDITRAYLLANDCARKYFYLLADEASSDQLLDVYKQFDMIKYNYADKETFNMFHEIALYYLNRAHHALFLEVCATKSEQQCLTSADAYYEKANTVSHDSNALKEAYLFAACSFIEKRLNLQDAFSFQDHIRLCHLFFERAKNATNLKEKDEFYERAMKIADQLLLELRSPLKDYSCEKTAPLEQRRNAAALYKLHAGLNYFAFVASQNKVRPHEQFNDKALEEIIFDTSWDKIYYERGRFALPENHVWVLQDEKRIQAIVRSARSTITMIDILGAETPHHLYPLALKILSAACSVLKQDDPLYEECLAAQMVYLQRRTADRTYRSTQNACNEAAELYHAIGHGTTNQHRRGAAYSEALTWFTNSLEGGSLYEFSDYSLAIDKVLLWADELSKASICPLLSRPRLYSTAATWASKALEGFMRRTPSKSSCETLYSKFLPAIIDKDYKPVSFSLLVTLTKYLYKAAWLSRDTTLFSKHLTRATHSLEQLLHNLPEDSWPTSNHYSFLGLSYRTLAQNVSDQNQKEKYEKQSRLYLDQAQKLRSAQTKAQKYLTWCPGLDQHASREASVDEESGVRELVNEFEERLNSLCTDDESSTSASKDTSLTSDELIQVEKTLTLQENQSAEALQSTPSLDRAFAIKDDSQQQEKHYRSFLRYAIDIPIEDRLLARHAGIVMRQPVSPEKRNRLLHEWQAALGELMPLIFLGHPQASTLLAVLFKNLREQAQPGAYAFRELVEPCLTSSLNVSPGSIDEVINLLIEGKTTAVVESILKHVPKGEQHVRLSTLLALHEPRNVNDDGADQLIGLCRTSAANMMTLGAATGQSNEYRIGVFNNAGSFYEKAIMMLATHNKLLLPEPKEYMDAYVAFKKARECKGITVELKKDISHNATRTACTLVDFLGDAAKEEDCMRAYNECLLEIQALEDYLASIASKINSKKILATKAQIVEVINDAKRYYTAYLRRAPKISLDTVARAFIEEAQALEKGSFEKVSSEKATSSTLKIPVKRCFVQQTCLLSLAAFYFKTWLDQFENMYDESQIAEAIKIYQLGYQRALSAGLPIIESHFLNLLITTLSKLQTHQVAVCKSHVEVLSVYQKLYDKICSDGPDALYNKAYWTYTKALSIQDGSTRYEELARASKHALDLIEVCRTAMAGNTVQTLYERSGAAEPLFNLTMRGQETSKKYSWIESWVASILLETAKYAPSWEHASNRLDTALDRLRITIPQQLESKVSLGDAWREIAKTLLRNKIETTKENASRSASASVTPVGKVPTLHRTGSSNELDGAQKVSWAKLRPQSVGEEDGEMPSPRRSLPTLQSDGAQLSPRTSGPNSPRQPNSPRHTSETSLLSAPARVTSTILSRSVGESGGGMTLTRSDIDIRRSPLRSAPAKKADK